MVYMLVGACLLLLGSNTIAAAQESETTAIAVVKGRTITEAEVTSFTALLQQTEGFASEDMSLAYIMQLVIPDLYTTATEEPKGWQAIPFKYKYPGQRGYLRNQLRQAIEKETTVTQQDMERWYAEKRDRYTTPERVHAYHVFMGTGDSPSSAPAVVRQKMLDLKSQAEKGTSFGLLAAKSSEAPSSAQGGEIGWLTYRMPTGPEGRPINIVLDKALFGLQTNQVSDVLQTSHGMHLLYVKEHQTTATPSLQDMITSGIAPQQARAERMTSAVLEAVQMAKQKHNARVLLDPKSTEQLTTETPAYEIDGKRITVHDLELLYGPRFTSIFARMRSDAQQVSELMGQALDDQAQVLAAEDRGLDKSSPEVQEILQKLAQRDITRKAMQAIVAQNYAATDDQARELYEQTKDKYRRPEASGWTLSFTVPETVRQQNGGG